jgi:hypothetical protein
MIRILLFSILVPMLTDIVHSAETSSPAIKPPPVSPTLKKTPTVSTKVRVKDEEPAPSLDPILAVRLTELLGVKPPASMSDAKFTKVDSMFTGGTWVAAKVSREDFLTMVQQLSLAKKTDILEHWPYAFTPPSKHRENDGWWDITYEVNDDTYFGYGRKPAAFIMAKFEKGRIFFKKTLVTEKTISE